MYLPCDIDHFGFSTTVLLPLKDIWKLTEQGFGLEGELLKNGGGVNVMD